ncbi:hypothetical protein [Sporanaerobacter acetigenes]|uniref:hypothetical protein n=1 Tax=Sporanaerobacter acetigenes TaxID=165813 RepID=UPI003331AE41
MPREYHKKLFAKMCLLYWHKSVKKDTEKCGWEYYEAQCCCGLVMAHQEIYCENHQ